ncbi:hypothetical protein E5676_scaffold79624G00020 [Cucumis melo var. makuwa]|nr:hypothetical protein E5676_scaffold79624G00020 [Cucumis melo var. makuwa]
MGGQTASPFGWGTLCAYVSKENQSPYVWGKYELSQILDEANAVARKKSLKKVKEKSARTKEAEENSEKYLLLDWLAVNLVSDRPLKTKELFLYGEKSTQKTLLIKILGKVLRIYSTGHRKNDYSGANHYSSLWTIDEFREKTDSASSFHQEEEGEYIHRLLTLAFFALTPLKTFVKSENVPMGRE